VDDTCKKSTSETKESSIVKTVELLKSSRKFKFLKANQMFDVKKIDTEMTLKKFKMLRKKKDIPIEDYMFKERYE